MRPHTAGDAPQLYDGFTMKSYTILLTRYSYAVGVYGTGCRVSVSLYVMDVLWLNGAR